MLDSSCCGSQGRILVALLEATKLFKNGSGGKEMPPFPAAPKLVRCWGREKQAVLVWAAPCSACSGSLLTTGEETKPPGVTEVRVRRERKARKKREAAVTGSPELPVVLQAPVWLSLSCAGAGLGWHAGDVKEQ